MATRKPIFGEQISDGDLYGEPIEMEHLEEAAEIKLAFPDYYDLVAQYTDLKNGVCNKSGNRYLNAVDLKAAQKLRSIGQRGLDIHAWSETYKGVNALQDLISNQNALIRILTGSELGEMGTEVLDYNPLTGVIFSFPTVGSLVELFLRLKNGDVNSGIVGIQTERGIIMHGTSHVGNFLVNNGIGSNALSITKKSVGTGVIDHGKVHVEFNIAIALCYLHELIINSHKKGDVIDIDGHLRFSSWFRKFIETKIPFEDEIDAILGAVNEAKNGFDYWANRIMSFFSGKSSSVDALKQAINNCRIEPFGMIGYAPFGTPTDELKFVAPGFDDTVTLDSGFQNLVRQTVSRITGGKAKYGDVFGPGAKELLSNASSLMDMSTHKLIHPFSKKGQQLIINNCASLDDISGWNDTPNDVTIQKPNRWSEDMGSNKSHVEIYTWAILANSCGLINNCIYRIG